MLLKIGIYHSDVSDEFIYFVCFYSCSMCICFKTTIWLFLTFLGQGLAMFSEDRLVTLSNQQQALSFIVCRRGLGFRIRD